MTGRDITTRNDSVTTGSISDIAHRRNESLELVMAEADVVVLFDRSSSMSERMPDGRSRFDHAVEQLQLVQKNNQGRIILISFSDNAFWSQGGMPPTPQGGTSLNKALDMALPFDGTGMKFVVISDGQPTDGKEMCLQTAARFTDQIHTIFIGHDHDPGKAFMDQLARNGGKSLGKTDVGKLSSGIAGLIGEGK